MRYFQQGDLLIKAIKSLPKEAKATKENILAHGEHTGHQHKFTSTNAKLYKFNEKLYLEALAEIEIEHEEHRTVIIPPGLYEIGRVREYDHFAEEARTIAD